MYTRRYDAKQSGYIPPDNYSGNAFPANEAPYSQPEPEARNNTPSEPPAGHTAPDYNPDSPPDSPPDHVPDAAPDSTDSTGHPPQAEPAFARQNPQYQQNPQYPPYCPPQYPPYCPPEPPKEKHGLLDGLLSRLKGFELDDLLLIGLIILLSTGKLGDDDCESGDDLMLILGLLLIMGT